MDNIFFLIAETAFSHQGDFNYLKAQIDEAAKGNADYIKFQIFINKKLYFSENHPSLNTIDKFMFSTKQWDEAIKYAIEKGLKIILLPAEIDAMKYCLTKENIIDGIELHSVCFNETSLLELIYGWGKLFFMGVGGRYIDEIEYAIKNSGVSKEKIILIHGFQSFPTNKVNIELGKLLELKNYFGCNTGYADHTKYDDESFIEICAYSYLLGVKYIEKHIVIACQEDRIDGSSAVTANNFLALRKKIIETNVIIGDRKVDELNEEENNYRLREKTIVANADILEGQIIEKEMLTYRIATSKCDFNQNDFYNIVGCKAISNIFQDEPILKDKVQKC